MFFASPGCLSILQPRSQSSLDVTSPVKLVDKIRDQFQASSANSDRAKWPGDEAVNFDK